jgi:hypothetical protein
MSTIPPVPDTNPSAPEFDVPPASPVKSGAKRRRFILLAAVLIGLVGTGVYFKLTAVLAESNTRSARAALAADGIAVIETNGDPDETASPFQSWEPPTVVRIQSAASKITDAELPKIAGISQDINLVLSSCPVTNDGLLRIAGKSNVRCLTLAKTAVNDDGMQHLQGMNLQSLDLSATKITDAGLATLGEFEFPRLKEVALEHTGITDAGLLHLAKFKNLEWVSAAGTKVTENGRRHLKAKIPNVTILL